MNVVIVAYGPDLLEAPREAEEVSNILQGAGHSVHVVDTSDVTLERLEGTSKYGPFDLAWLIVHSGTEGFALADQDIEPSLLGKWLNAIGCWQAVLNSCYSAEHVAVIQQEVAADIVATINPKGVRDRRARLVGICLARALAESGDLEKACVQTVGGGSLQYRWFPFGDVLRDGRRMGVETIEDQITSLVRAVRGDPDNGYVGLVGRVQEIQGQLGVFHADTERKLAMLRVMDTALALIILAIIVLVLLRLGGVI